MFSKVSKSQSKTDDGSSRSRPVSKFISQGVAPSIISANLKVTGNLESHGDIQIDGVIEGDVRSDSVTIGEQATVKGSIEADKVHVAGTVNGQINARLVELMQSAKVTGDILHESLAIEAGAFIEGLCRHVSGNSSAPAISSSDGEQPTVNAAPTYSQAASAVDAEAPTPMTRPVTEEAGKSKGGVTAATASRGQEVVSKVFR